MQHVTYYFNQISSQWNCIPFVLLFGTWRLRRLKTSGFPFTSWWNASSVRLQLTNEFKATVNRQWPASGKDWIQYMSEHGSFTRWKTRRNRNIAQTSFLYYVEWRGCSVRWRRSVSPQATVFLWQWVFRLIPLNARFLIGCWRSFSIFGYRRSWKVLVLIVLCSGPSQYVRWESWIEIALYVWIVIWQVIHASGKRFLFLKVWVMWLCIGFVSVFGEWLSTSIPVKQLWFQERLLKVLEQP